MIPTRPPRVVSTRGGTSFWVHAANDGVKATVLTVPVTFPPEELAHGAMLGGLPLPDLRGTLGTFYYWATDLSSFEEGNTEFGGFLKRLLFDGGVAETLLKGPDSPVLRQEEAALKEKKKGAGLTDKEQERLEQLATGKDISLPMRVRWSEGSGKADLEIQDVALDCLRSAGIARVTMDLGDARIVRGLLDGVAVDAARDVRRFL